jgi:hypothetical protein
VTHRSPRRHGPHTLDLRAIDRAGRGDDPASPMTTSRRVDDLSGGYSGVFTFGWPLAGRLVIRRAVVPARCVLELLGHPRFEVTLNTASAVRLAETMRAIQNLRSRSNQIPTPHTEVVLDWLTSWHDAERISSPTLGVPFGDHHPRYARQRAGHHGPAAVSRLLDSWCMTPYFPFAKFTSSERPKRLVAWFRTRSAVLVEREAGTERVTVQVLSTRRSASRTRVKLTVAQALRELSVEAGMDVLGIAVELGWQTDRDIASRHQILARLAHRRPSQRHLPYSFRALAQQFDSKVWPQNVDRLSPWQETAITTIAVFRWLGQIAERAEQTGGSGSPR